jgi:hypothetical protein
MLLHCSWWRSFLYRVLPARVLVLVRSGSGLCLLLVLRTM